MFSPQNARHHQSISTDLGKQGVIVAYTHIHHKPENVIARTPYYVALVQFDDGNRQMIQVVREHDTNITIGSCIETIVRKHTINAQGLITYTLKAKLVE
jgi:uncharacterized OB-fold protein